MGKHSIWRSPNGIMLLGMSASGGEATTEILTDDGKSDVSFLLKEKRNWACSIQFEEKVILIGGYDSASKRLVAEYNKDGFVKYLPETVKVRTGSGCGSYVDEDDNDVLIVVGGYWSDTEDTERLIYGQVAWTLLGPTYYKVSNSPVLWWSKNMKVVTIENELIATGCRMKFSHY